MADYPGWYPPGQVCYPPELPTYLKSVHDLKPITGVPSDEEVIEIHAVIQVANRASIPGMYNPGLLMELGDHLFSAQMAVYRNKYTSLLFPNDAIYAPPTLPAHVSINLEPISGIPSDEQVFKVQEAIRSYQKYSEIPSMFETRVNAELSQHLFDIQMARYMARAAQRQSSRMSRGPIQPTPARITEPVTDLDEGVTAHETTNNAGTGTGCIESHLPAGTDICDILKQSNQLSEQSNKLIEQSNKIIEKNNQLIERSNLPVEPFTRPTDQSNNVTEQFSQLVGQMNKYLERSGQLAEAFKPPVEQIGDTLKNINKVLVGIQHAIVRSRKGNTGHSMRSLINEKGDVPMKAWLWFPEANGDKVNLIIDGENQPVGMNDNGVAYLLRFFGVEGDFFKDPNKKKLSAGEMAHARNSLGIYLTSALGS